jgi:hypothetical protein
LEVSPPPKRPLAHDSRILLALACLPFLPTAPSDQTGHHTTGETRRVQRLTLGWASPGWHTPVCGPDAESSVGEKDQGSFGCSVNLPLGSRSVDPHSTAVGVETCSTPVLNRTQRSCVATPHSVEYSLLQPRSALGDAQAGSTPNRIRSHSCPFYTTMLCLGCHIAGRL